MAEASAHDKQVEDLMGAEILVSGIEERKLQCIDDTADGVDDASGYEPQEGCGGEGGYQRHHGEDTEPSHGNIDQRGKTFGTGDPEGFDQDACNGGPPYENKERDACGVSKGNHADRRIASGNQNKDHHMIDFSQKPVDFFRYVQCVIDGACTVEQDHAQGKHGKGQNGVSAIVAGSRHKKRRGCGSSQ